MMSMCENEASALRRRTMSSTPAESPLAVSTTMRQPRSAPAGSNVTAAAIEIASLEIAAAEDLLQRRIPPGEDRPVARAPTARRREGANDRMEALANFIGAAIRAALGGT